MDLAHPAATTERSEVPFESRHDALWLPAVSLCRREIVRFLRQKHRIIGALATPIVFWLLIGGGMGRSFRSGSGPGSDNFIVYFFPGTVLMILLFTAIFSTISIIEDRREGFLQSVLAAPVSRMAIVLGKVLGGALLAFGQGLLFLLLAPLVGVKLTVAGFALALVFMLLLSFALTALGFCIAWRMTSTQGFHAIMNLFLMPLWFLSGALFPPDGAAKPLAWVMRLNPLSYGLAGLRQAMYWGVPGAGGSMLGGWATCLVVTLLLAAALFAAACGVAGVRSAADLQ